VGVVTRRDLFGRRDAVRVGDLVTRAPVTADASWLLRDAADAMVRHGVGRLPVIDAAAPHRVVGVITRSDLLGAHAGRLESTHTREPGIWRAPRA
jgi:CBS domain-containing protein